MLAAMVHHRLFVPVGVGMSLLSQAGGAACVETLSPAHANDGICVSACSG